MYVKELQNINWETWNAFVAANAEDGGVLQSWEWGEFQKALGRRVWRLAWGEKEIQAVCLLVEHKLPLRWTYLYASRGPVLKNPNDKGYILNILGELEKFSREQGAIFFRVEPPYENFKFQISNFKFRTTSSIQPQQTLRIDLTRSEEELLKRMHQKTRYNIGLAEKRGVRVEEKNTIETFFALLETTTARDGFRMHPREHYETILSTLDARLFFASQNGQPLATALVAFFGNTAYYLHGASANEHRDMMAPYALHWHIMREAKRRGCTAYDLWGVDEKRWPGVTRFKQGFVSGAASTRYGGTFDLPLRRIPYCIYTFSKYFRR